VDRATKADQMKRPVVATIVFLASIGFGLRMPVAKIGG
jgi:hypothetical protein